MRRAVQLVDALHANRGCTAAFNLRAHLDEQIDQIGHFRLARGVGRAAVSPSASTAGSQNIFRAGHGNLVEMNLRAAQSLAAALRT